MNYERDEPDIKTKGPLAAGAIVTRGKDNRDITTHRRRPTGLRDAEQHTGELLTIPEFASALNVTVACVRRWIFEKRLDHVKLGRLVRIPPGEVDRLIADGFRPAENRRPHVKAR